MFSLFRKKGSGEKNSGQEQKPKLPDWAEFFSAEEYATFIGMVEAYFGDRGIPAEINDGVVISDDQELGLGQMGLQNIAQLCRQIEPESWNEAITAHFNSLVESSRFSREFEKFGDDFDFAKQYLGVRLYAAESIASIGTDKVIGDFLTEDIFRMLVYDFPQSVHNVQPSQLEAWSRSREEVFETGRNNIRENYEFMVHDHTIGEVPIKVVDGEHFFVPNIVFDLENNPELLGTHGALIGLPHRHAAIFYPIETAEVIPALHTLIPLVNGMYEEGPGSVSNNIILYQNGTFTKIPYAIENDALTITPPKSFVDLLTYLSSEE